MEDLPLGYRPNVGVCLINSDDQVEVLRSRGMKKLPPLFPLLVKGHNLYRLKTYRQVPKWLTYDFPPVVKAKVNRLWGGEWHGQAQKCLDSDFVDQTFIYLLD